MQSHTLEEISNSASLQKMEREALAAALAIGSIGKETFGQQNIRVPENGGLYPSSPGILLISTSGKRSDYLL